MGPSGQRILLISHFSLSDMSQPLNDWEPQPAPDGVDRLTKLPAELLHQIFSLVEVEAEWNPDLFLISKSLSPFTRLIPFNAVNISTQPSLDRFVKIVLANATTAALQVRTLALEGDKDHPLDYSGKQFWSLLLNVEQIRLDQCSVPFTVSLLELSDVHPALRLDKLVNLSIQDYNLDKSDNPSQDYLDKRFNLATVEQVIRLAPNLCELQLWRVLLYLEPPDEPSDDPLDKVDEAGVLLLQHTFDDALQNQLTQFCNSFPCLCSLRLGMASWNLEALRLNGSIVPQQVATPGSV